MKLSPLQIRGVLIVLAISLLWGCEMLDYGNEIPQFNGTSARVRGDGAWIIDLNQASKLYGCSIWVNPGTVEDVTFSMSIDSTPPPRDTIEYEDFEPRWVRFDPIDIIFEDTVSIGLHWGHIPSSISGNLEFVEFLPISNSFKVHEIVRTASHGKAAYIEVTKLGIFALLPSE